MSRFQYYATIIIYSNLFFTVIFDFLILPFSVFCWHFQITSIEYLLYSANNVVNLRMSLIEIIIRKN